MINLSGRALRISHKLFSIYMCISALIHIYWEMEKYEVTFSQTSSAASRSSSAPQCVASPHPETRRKPGEARERRKKHHGNMPPSGTALPKVLQLCFTFAIPFRRYPRHPNGFD